MKTVYLLACTKSKIDIGKGDYVPARELYCDSTLFRKSRALAEYAADEWYILSAVYGLLDPEEEIATYDLTLYDEPIHRRRAWARAVLSDLLEILSPGDTVVFLAGKRYREFLEPALEEMGFDVEVPMEGLEIGYQYQWLNKELSRRGIEA